MSVHKFTGKKIVIISDVDGHPSLEYSRTIILIGGKIVGSLKKISDPLVC